MLRATPACSSLRHGPTMFQRAVDNDGPARSAAAATTNHPRSYPGEISRVGDRLVRTTRESDVVGALPPKRHSPQLRLCAD